MMSDDHYKIKRLRMVLEQADDLIKGYMETIEKNLGGSLNYGRHIRQSIARALAAYTVDGGVDHGGMFDSLRVGCPCGQEVEFQSKAGDCRCSDYNLYDCPPKIAADLLGETERCKCGRYITIRGHVILMPDYGSPVSGGTEHG